MKKSYRKNYEDKVTKMQFTIGIQDLI